MPTENKFGETKLLPSYFNIASPVKICKQQKSLHNYSGNPEIKQEENPR